MFHTVINQVLHVLWYMLGLKRGNCPLRPSVFPIRVTKNNEQMN